MATLLSTTVSAELTITIQLTEPEVRALDAMFGYSPEAFLQGFYKQLGETYVKPHEAGVRSLHSTIRSLCAGPLDAIRTARRVIQQSCTPR